MVNNGYVEDLLSYLADWFILNVYSLLENSDFIKAQSNTKFDAFMPWQVWAVHFGSALPPA